MVWGDAVSKLEMFEWILLQGPYTLVAIQLNNTKLEQMTNLNVFFHVVCFQFITWIIFVCNLTHSSAQLRNSQCRIHS